MYERPGNWNIYEHFDPCNCVLTLSLESIIHFSGVFLDSPVKHSPFIAVLLLNDYPVMATTLGRLHIPAH